jgi:hypothetical protein
VQPLIITTADAMAMTTARGSEGFFGYWFDFIGDDRSLD